jgi:undecaprenyl diphosphate synthase
MIRKIATSSPQQITRFPNHVAIIMDGNGRWAERLGLPRLKGHQAGVKRVHSVTEYLYRQKVKYVTLYGFSTENWARPKEEIKGLFQLLEEAIGRETPQLHKQGVKLRHLGRLRGLPQGVQRAIRWAEELTKNNDKMVLSFAFNYGGRTEILDAVRCIITQGIPPEKIDEKLFKKYLYAADLPDVDLLIRTGGELRISNFLIWQSAYSEFYFTKVLWPDLTDRHLAKALLAYSQRQRRYGGL